ncbi:NAD(P)H-hydrate dehydratase [Macrococcus bovicus]|uniref:ADP-dependent (S)-NAD(P)H-hydrate dehydratase n=1 Tax=Macrococcus bovicus TaxID=69968 RepID=A0A4R6BYF8_9STAP|nr:NAD(P)H-hydrate dehydratase [Macrococcus bovicus]TDM13589.1 NAD(P)H-hydrate dehydratase [Macrococcus bovicus]WJP97818.1 NAD(P)H-hydrate dehydratase [Macrococcus bovicus]
MQTIDSITIPKREDQSHKGDYGRILLIGGNQNMGGSIMLSSRACVYSGGGLTTVCTHHSNHTALHSRCPEAMVSDLNDIKRLTKLVTEADCILVGPGLGLDIKGNNTLTFILQHVQPHQTIIIDGDAITIFSKLRLTLPDCEVIFTPHQMEWERLSGIKIDDQTPERNRQAADELGAHVILKKHHTELYLKTGDYKIDKGNPAMATGGMGDTLAGMIAGFIGQFETEEAIKYAVYIHSKIGDQLSQTMYVTPPSMIINEIPFMMKKLEAK